MLLTSSQDAHRASLPRSKYLRRWHLEALLRRLQGSQQARRLAGTWQCWVDAQGAEELARLLVSGEGPSPASHRFLMLFSTPTPRMKSFQVWPLDLLSLKPGAGPGICIAHTPRGILIWVPQRGWGPRRAQVPEAAVAQSGAWALSPQLRQWRLRWVWRTWRRRVVQLQVSWRLQQRAEGRVLAQVLVGQPQPPAALPKPAPELQALPACHPRVSSFAGEGQFG